MHAHLASPAPGLPGRGADGDTRDNLVGRPVEQTKVPGVVALRDVHVQDEPVPVEERQQLALRHDRQWGARRYAVLTPRANDAVNVKRAGAVDRRDVQLERGFSDVIGGSAGRQAWGELELNVAVSGPGRPVADFRI